MRPNPRTRHLLAVMVFAAISAACAYLAMIDDRLSTTQVDIATVALKLDQPQLFANDGVFGTQRWQFYTPAFQAIVKVLLAGTGYQDVTFPFRALAGPLLMLYLCGMYCLLYYQCKSWSVSAFTAVLSSAVTYTLGKSFWGVGPLGAIIPPTLVTAVAPLIVLAFLKCQTSYRVLLVFAGLGLTGNIHLVSAVNLSLVLVIAYLAGRRFRPAAWPMAAGCLVCALLGALPYVLQYLNLRYSAAAAGASVDVRAAYQAFRLGDLAIMYPDMLKSLLYWLLLVGAVLLPAAAVLSRVERFKVRDLGTWVWFAAGAFFVAIVLHGASQLIGAIMNRTPAVIDFARASNLVMLSVYVLFAQAITHLFRLVRTHKALLRWACAAFMAAWMLPSDNLRPARHLAYGLALDFMEEDQKPPRLLEIEARRQSDQELAAIADWARKYSDVGAVFMVNRAEFRMLSRRAIIASGDDVAYYYYVTPWQLGDWGRLIERQRAALQPVGGQADPAAIGKFIDQLKTQGLQTVPQWYVVLPIARSPAASATLQPIDSGDWGRCFQLFRARPRHPGWKQPARDD